VKQRFLNQKLGKRMSRKAELLKTKTLAEKAKPGPKQPSLPGQNASPRNPG
jgi:hypothetical protein